MTNWEIHQGSYGRTYRAVIENENLSDCTAKIYVFSGETYLIDGEDCSVSFSNPDTHIDYPVKADDFATASVGTYDVLITLLKIGVIERVKKFKWEVLAKEP